ncbi:MAG: hypothetical protein ACO3TG_01645 [Minisyncoccia bacterium]
MKIRNLVIVFILQLIVILGLFAYFYTQKRDINPIVYLPIINKEGETDKLKFDISEIDEYLFQYNDTPEMQSEVYNKTSLSLKVGDTVYLKLDQYGGVNSTSIILATTDMNSINKHAYYEYDKMAKKPFITGKIVEIKIGKPEQGEPTKYLIEYGIEDLNFEAKSLVGAVAKVSLNSNGEAKILEIYQDNKIIYKAN